jgi:hypothetical protein
MIPDQTDPLRSLRAMPLDISMESTMAHLANVRRRRRIRRVIAAASVIGTLVLGVGILQMSHDATPESSHRVRPSLPSTSNVVATPHVQTPPAPTRRAVPKRRTTASPATTDKLPVVVGGSELLRVLAVDLRAMTEIRAQLGSGDRVVVVDNTTDRETCIQVTCEGGDSRSIVCMAPAPSPVRVTTTSGRLLYDIDRADGTDRPGPFLPIRVSVGGDDVLLWYEASAELRAKLGADVAMPTMPSVRSWLRPDRATSFLRTTGTTSWSSVTVRRLDGSAADVRVQWLDHADGTTEAVMHPHHRGTYDVSVVRRDGSTDRFLHVVR